MMDLSSYPWFKSLETFDESKEAQAKLQSVLKAIEKKESNDVMRNIYAQYYLEYVKPEGLNAQANLNKMIRSWAKSNAFKQLKEKMLHDDKVKFQLSGIWSVATGTLVIYFLWAVISQDFLINFSIDAIVGAVAILFLYRNMKVQLKLLKAYGIAKNYILLDIAAFLLCFMLKIAIQFIDISLIVLLITYYIQKRRFDKFLKEF